MPPTASACTIKLGSIAAVMDEESHFPFSIIFQLRRSENRKNAASPACF